MPPRTKAMSATRGEIENLRDKFMLAVHSMAESDVALRERLRDAMAIVLCLREADMPNEQLRGEFHALVWRTTRVEVPRGDGTLSVTVGFMADDELRSAAKLLCSIHEGLTYAADEARDEP
jgi:hypothetical protein